MTGTMLYLVIGVLVFFALGGTAFVFIGPDGGTTKKRMAAVARPTASARIIKGAIDTNQQRRKNVQGGDSKQ